MTHDHGFSKACPSGNHLLEDGIWPQIVFYCYKCCNTGEVWADRFDVKNRIYKMVGVHGLGWKTGTELWRNWKKEHTIPCGECTQ